MTKTKDKVLVVRGAAAKSPLENLCDVFIAEGANIFECLAVGLSACLATQFRVFLVLPLPTLSGSQSSAPPWGILVFDNSTATCCITVGLLVLVSFQKVEVGYCCLCQSRLQTSCSDSTLSMSEGARPSGRLCHTLN